MHIEPIKKYEITGGVLPAVLSQETRQATLCLRLLMKIFYSYVWLFSTSVMHTNLYTANVVIIHFFSYTTNTCTCCIAWTTPTGEYKHM